MSSACARKQLTQTDVCQVLLPMPVLFAMQASKSPQPSGKRSGLSRNLTTRGPTLRPVDCICARQHFSGISCSHELWTGPAQSSARWALGPFGPRLALLPRYIDDMGGDGLGALLTNICHLLIVIHCFSQFASEALTF